MFNQSRREFMVCSVGGLALTGLPASGIAAAPLVAPLSRCPFEAFDVKVLLPGKDIFGLLGMYADHRLNCVNSVAFSVPGMRWQPFASRTLLLAFLDIRRGASKDPQSPWTAIYSFVRPSSGQDGIAYSHSDLNTLPWGDGPIEFRAIKEREGR